MRIFIQNIFEMREAKIARETAFEMWKALSGEQLGPAYNSRKGRLRFQNDSQWQGEAPARAGRTASLAVEAIMTICL